MTDLEVSEVVVAKIINALLKKGLKPETLKETDFGISHEQQSYVNTSVKWLENENIIFVEQIHQAMDGGCILVNPSLTSEGFRILGNSFIGKPGSETVASAINTVATENRSYSGIGDLIGGILGGFTKSIGS